MKTAMQKKMPFGRKVAKYTQKAKKLPQGGKGNPAMNKFYVK